MDSQQAGDDYCDEKNTKESRVRLQPQFIVRTTLAWNIFVSQAIHWIGIQKAPANTIASWIVQILV
jgi:hypothetical protein